MIMFSDTCEAGRFLGDGDILYYINDVRCSREEFHRYRAKEGLTDFVDTEFSVPITYNKISIGHWSSFVNDWVQNYLKALSYNDSIALTFCGMDMRDRYMTIDQVNYLYYRSKERDYLDKVCSSNKLVSCATCHHTPEDVRTCIDIAERKASDDAYNEWAMKEFAVEREEMLESVFEDQFDFDHDSYYE
jgi:hypothetical protein